VRLGEIAAVAHIHCELRQQNADIATRENRLVSDASRVDPRPADITDIDQLSLQTFQGECCGRGIDSRLFRQFSDVQAGMASQEGKRSGQMKGSLLALNGVV